MISSTSRLAVVAGLFVLMGPVNCSSADDVARPNVLFIAVDDLRPTWAAMVIRS